MIQNLSSDHKKLGLYQFIGGLYGILMTVVSIINKSGFNEMQLLLYTPIFLFFGFSIYCGWLCLKAHKMH